MTADVELLPCPWCGGKIEGNVSEGSTFRWRKVDGCCTDGPEVRHNTTAPDQGIAEHESRIAAINAWNTRAATAAKDAEITHERWLREQAENRCVAVEDQREALREERDALRKALGRILENEASDWKAAEEFGGYVLYDELREEALAALTKENSND